mmetsp:Transcript_12650/g.38118  ORF Transcript_12650/g.38118 Transcript_12650/m.38118 type:complete len:225 (-) Transcript_12650:1154-1828(-)
MRQLALQRPRRSRSRENLQKRAQGPMGRPTVESPVMMPPQPLKRRLRDHQRRCGVRRLPAAMSWTTAQMMSWIHTATAGTATAGRWQPLSGRGASPVGKLQRRRQLLRLALRPPPFHPQPPPSPRPSMCCTATRPITCSSGCTSTCTTGCELHTYVATKSRGTWLKTAMVRQTRSRQRSTKPPTTGSWLWSRTSSRATPMPQLTKTTAALCWAPGHTCCSRWRS